MPGRDPGPRLTAHTEAPGEAPGELQGLREARGWGRIAVNDKRRNGKKQPQKTEQRVFEGVGMF